MSYAQMEDSDEITINLRDVEDVSKKNDVEDVEYIPRLTEMTATERRLHDWFNNSSEKLASAVRIADERVAQRKRFHKCATSHVFYLSGDSPITTKEDFERLKKQLINDTKKIKFIAIGPPEKSSNGRIHQHGIAIYDTVCNFHKIPELVKADGSKMSIAFGDVTSYSKNTGDFRKYIYYMNKNSDDITKCFMMENNGFLDSEGKMPAPQKRDINDDWRKCLELDDMGLAVRTMNQWHPVSFPAKEGQFTRIWMREHYMKQVKDQIREKNFVNWKEDSPQCRMIRNWIWRAKDPNNQRPGNLFIVGPSLTGKSEYINRMLVLPHTVFKLRGKLMFDVYDPTVEYEFMVLDDMEDINKEYIAICKTMTSGAKGEWNVANVKYSHAQPRCMPIIHLMNWEKFYRFMKTVQTTGAYNAWWKDNMEVIIVTDYLFPTDKEINESLSNDEKVAKNFAMRQILYKHPNRKVEVGEGNNEEVEAFDESDYEPEEQEDRKHYMKVPDEVTEVLTDFVTKVKRKMN